MLPLHLVRRRRWRRRCRIATHLCRRLAPPARVGGAACGAGHQGAVAPHEAAARSWRTLAAMERPARAVTAACRDLDSDSSCETHGPVDGPWAEESHDERDSISPVDVLTLTSSSVVVLLTIPPSCFDSGSKYMHISSTPVWNVFKRSPQHQACLHGLLAPTFTQGRR